MDSKTENIINELIKEIRKVNKSFSGIYLFGSRARGDNNNDSDYDLAMVFDSKLDSTSKSNIRNIISDVMVRNDILIDNPFVVKSDLENKIMPLYDNILNEGIYYT